MLNTTRIVINTDSEFRKILRNDLGFSRQETAFILDALRKARQCSIKKLAEKISK